MGTIEDNWLPVLKPIGVYNIYYITVYSMIMIMMIYIYKNKSLPWLWLLLGRKCLLFENVLTVNATLLFLPNTSIWHKNRIINSKQ